MERIGANREALSRVRSAALQVLGPSLHFTQYLLAQVCAKWALSVKRVLER